MKTEGEQSEGCWWKQSDHRWTYLMWLHGTIAHSIQYQIRVCRKNIKKFMNIKAMPQSLLLDCISVVYKTSPVLMHSRNCFQFCLMFNCDYRLEMLFSHEMKFSDSLVYEHSWLLTLIPGLSSLLTALDGSGWDMIDVTAIMCYVSLLVCHFALSDFNLAPVRRSGTNSM